MPKAFRHLIAARFLFTLAVQIQAVVLGWRMYVLTQDPLCLGLVGLAEAVPALGLALHAGYLVDRGCPFTIYRRVILVSLTSGFIMLVSQLDAVGLPLAAQVAGLFLSSMLTGVARAFSQPVIYAMVPRIVDRDLLTRGSALMSTSLQIARVSGPAAGGLLFAASGINGATAVVCAALFAAYSCTLLLPKMPRGSIPESNSRKKELLLGARFVFSHPILLPALSLDMISVLFGGVTALLPIFAAEILMVGPTGLGALRAAPAVGAVVISLLLTVLDFRRNAGRWLITAVFGFGVSILVFAISQDFWLSLVALAASGGFDSVSVVIRSSAVQLSSPENMRGRVSAVNSMFIGSSNEIGEFESGVLARLIGVVPAALFGGCACLATVAIVAILFPRLRKLDLRELEKIG